LPGQESGNQSEALTEEEEASEEDEPKPKKRAVRRSLAPQRMTQTNDITNIDKEKHLRSRRSLASNLMPALASR